MSELNEKVDGPTWVAAIIVVAAGLFFIWPSSGNGDDERRPGIDFSIPTNLGASNVQKLNQALHLFLEACPGLTQMHFDRYAVEEVEDFYNPWRSYDQSWHTLVRIKLTHQVPDPFYPGTTVTENLYYDLGGGDAPGIRAGKHSSRRACGGFPADADTGTLLPVRGLKIVDSIKLPH